MDLESVSDPLSASFTFYTFTQLSVQPLLNVVVVVAALRLLLLLLMAFRIPILRS
jgi:hypothetical protein